VDNKEAMTLEDWKKRSLENLREILTSAERCDLAGMLYSAMMYMYLRSSYRPYSDEEAEEYSKHLSELIDAEKEMIEQAVETIREKCSLRKSHISV